MRSRACLFVVGYCLCITLSWAQLPPKNLLVYYGYPSLINGSNANLTTAASQFAQYDYVVLGDGLEFTTHGDHANTQTIVTSSATSNTRFFGYIDLGVSTQNRSIAEIQNRIDLWKATGVDGIFLDDYGYDFKVGRQRQNDAVSYAHAQGLPVIANGFNPDDVFGQATDATYNPTGAATVLNGSDFYFSESYLISEGSYTDPTFWKTKADKLKAYQVAVPFRILSITTNSSDNTYNQDKFFYNWYGAFLYNHTATGWGEYVFSANNNQAPFRTRPVISSPGTRFLTGVRVQGSEYSRFTDGGKIWINTSTHQYGFTPAATCQSNGSGAWTSAATWSCSRIPYPCDPVIVSAANTVTISTDVDAAKLTVRGKVTFSSSAGHLSIWP